MDGPARLGAVAVLALVLFGYPFVPVFDLPELVLGVPVLWLYLFGAWALVLVLIARVGRGS